MAVQPIEFETPRLRLRLWREDDLAPFSEMNADPQVMRYFPSTQTQQQSAALVELWRAQFQEQGWSNWAVALRRSGEFIGFIGLSVPGRVLPFSPCVEIGWRLKRTAWGQGLASEGANACLQVGFERLGLEEIVSFTALQNLPSVAVMERIGMSNANADFEHPVLTEGHPLRPHCLYRLSRSDWLRRDARPHAGRPAMPAPATDPRSQNITLRAAVVDDALCLSVLAMQVFLDTYATEGIRPALAREVLAGYSEIAFRAEMVYPQSRWIVAERAGHLIGFAQITLEAVHELAPAGRQAELLRLYVQEPFTRMGIGTRLLERAEREARGAGATVLWLTFWAHNHRARAFYEMRGYRDFGMTSFTFEEESHENRVYARSLQPVDGSGGPAGSAGYG